MEAPDFSRGGANLRARGKSPTALKGALALGFVMYTVTYCNRLITLMALAPQSERTFFVTSATYGRAALFRSARMAELLINCFSEHRHKDRFSLHEFVVMPNHFHLLLTPAPHVPLEEALQFIKGGFSYRAKRELRVNFAIWQPGFTNHRIRNWQDYEQHRLYIRFNPLRAKLVERAELYPYSSAYSGVDVDGAPPWLKPNANSYAFAQSV